MSSDLDLGRYVSDLGKLMRTAPAGVEVFLPVPMAAASLEVEPTTIRSYVRNGTLVDMKINAATGESWSGVTLASVIAEVNRRDQNVQRYVDPVREALEQLTDDTIEYGKLMAMFDMSWRNPSHRGLLGNVLGRVSEASLEEHKVMLSVCVVSKATGRPNESFFNLARHLELLDENGDDEEFWVKHMAKLKRWKAKNR